MKVPNKPTVTINLKNVEAKKPKNDPVAAFNAREES